MVFMGDELGLPGDDGEHARTPMPWGDTARFGADLHRSYRELLGLRRRLEPLRRGGMRWLVAGEDPMAWLRETPERAGGGRRVPRRRVAELPVSLVGECETVWAAAGRGRRARVRAVQVSLPGRGRSSCAAAERRDRWGSSRRRSR